MIILPTILGVIALGRGGCRTEIRPDTSISIRLRRPQRKNNFNESPHLRSLGPIHLDLSSHLRFILGVSAYSIHIHC
jgi:hypothetical protein